MDEVFAAGGTVLAKPWGQRAQHPGLFTKLDFKIDLRSQLTLLPKRLESLGCARGVQRVCAAGTSMRLVTQGAAWQPADQGVSDRESKGRE